MDRLATEPNRDIGAGHSAGRLLPLVYDQLKGLARHYMRSERADHTLEPTAVVHEAYLRLARADGSGFKDKTHFLAIAATQMRRVLIEHARAHRAAKRGGGGGKVTLTSRLQIAPDGIVDILELDEALERLATHSARQARVVELRFFAGMSLEETAGTLGVSIGTVKGDWRLARAWLARELDCS